MCCLVLKTLTLYNFLYPISDLTLKMYTLFQTLWYVVILATLNRIYGIWDFVTPQTMFVFFSSRSMSTETHITLKMVSQTKHTEYYTLFQTKMEKSIPYFRLEMLNNDDTLWGGTTYMACIWVYPPPGLICLDTWGPCKKLTLVCPPSL